MKNFIYVFNIICFILIGCQDKTNVPFPNATFTVEINDSNIATFNFKLNEGEQYTLDFGDGNIYTDSLTTSNMNKSPIIKHEYKTNGLFLTTLNIKSLAGIDKKQVTINANNAISADFSYEILENGKVKFTNLSKKATSYEWAITHYSTVNAIQWPNYISSDKDISITVDLSGYYVVKLDAIGKQITTRSSTQKIVNITGLKKQMEFSGYYDGKRINGSLESNQLSYNCGWITFTGKGLYQSISSVILKDSSKTPYIKFYPLLFGRNSPQEEIDAKPEYRYTRLKEYFAESKDPDIIEVVEETLEPNFYNNTKNFYPKAFWVKYRVKNEILDGELKVRVLVYGFR